MLKPKVKFEWTEELQKQFVKSKKEIVDKIIEGVHLFDPTLPTCLATDFFWGWNRLLFLTVVMFMQLETTNLLSNWLEVVPCRQQVLPPCRNTVCSN